MDYALYQKISKVTLGKQPADLVLKNLKLVDVFTGEIVESNVAVKDGLIAGVSRRYRGKKEIDLGGKYLAPGFIDAHLHLESTMVTPNELVSTAARFGTTTFIVIPMRRRMSAVQPGLTIFLIRRKNLRRTSMS